MKKKIVILLTILTLCLTGCVVDGGESEYTQKESQTETLQQTEQPDSDTAETTHEISNQPEDDYSKRY